MLPNTLLPAASALQPVDDLFYVGDQSGITVAIPNGSASVATQLPLGTVRMTVLVDVDAFMRLGGNSVAATNASAFLKAGVPYHVGVRSTETYASFFGVAAAGNARIFRRDVA